MDAGTISLILSSVTAITALVVPVILKIIDLIVNRKNFLRDSAKEKYEIKLNTYTEFFSNISCLLIDAPFDKNNLIASILKVGSICDEKIRHDLWLILEHISVYYGMEQGNSSLSNHFRFSIIKQEVIDNDYVNKAGNVLIWELIVSLNDDLQSDYDKIKNCTKNHRYNRSYQSQRQNH